MPTYTYIAKAGPQETVSDTMQAESKGMVIKRLKEQGLFPVIIEEASSGETPRKKRRLLWRPDTAEFTRQLAELIQAGIPLSKALSLLRSQEQNPGMQELLGSLEEGVLHGLSFSDALAQSPRFFSSFYLTMVRIGESSGHLADSLDRLAEFKEKEGALRAQILSALAYPSFVLAVGLFTVFFMVTFFIPRLSLVFADLNQDLPGLTRLVIGVSRFFQKSWWLLLALAGAAGVAARSFLRQDALRLGIDRLLLRLPLVKGAVQKMETSRFAYAFGVLLRNGVPMVSALRVIGLTVENRVFRQSLSGFESQIRKGKDLSACLREAGIFSVVLVNMVTVGEESGELGDMLLRAAGIFEAQLNRTLKTLVSLLEPLLILLIGGVVVIIVFAMLFPIFEMNFMIQ